MTPRALFVAVGLCAAGLTPAVADSVTATVTHWDAANRTITLEDHSKFADIPATVSVPADLKIGDEVTVDFQGDEDGIAAYNSVTIIRDIAKRQVPKKRG